PLLRARLAAADVEAAVHLHAVGADDLAVRGLRHLHRQLRLARGGGAHDHEERRAASAHRQRRPTLRSSSDQLKNVTTGRPCGQCPAKSAPSSARSNAVAASADNTSPDRTEPWHAIVASARSTAPENSRPPLRPSSESRSRTSRSGLARCSSRGMACTLSAWEPRARSCSPTWAICSACCSTSSASAGVTSSVSGNNSACAATVRDWYCRRSLLNVTRSAAAC